MDHIKTQGAGKAAGSLRAWNMEAKDSKSEEHIRLEFGVVRGIRVDFVPAYPAWHS
jgi:hypothetical protein